MAHRDHALPPVLSHDDAVAMVQSLARASDAVAIAGAFLASLGEAPGFWRAPLCALAAASVVPAHPYRPFSKQTPDCAECGLLPSVEPGEIDERGQCLPGDLASALVVLDRARREEPPGPRRADAQRLSRVLALVGGLPPAAREGKLTDAIRAAKLVAGNRYDVRAVIETLGACGILQTPEHPGFTTQWTSFAARQARPSSRIECDPPIAFWTAAHGVDPANTQAWFGSFGVRVGAATQPRAAQVAKASAGAAQRARRAARSTELEVGDAIAIPWDGAWYAAVVVQHHADAGGRLPVLEALEFRGTEPPSIEALKGLRSAGARVGKGLVRNALLMDLWVKSDPKGRWRIVGGGLDAPSRDHLLASPGLYGVGSLGKDSAGLRKLLSGVVR